MCNESQSHAVCIYPKHHRSGHIGSVRADSHSSRVQPVLVQPLACIFAVLSDGIETKFRAKASPAPAPATLRAHAPSRFAPASRAATLVPNRRKL